MSENKFTNEEAEIVCEKFAHYIQFNFESIALNRITWDTGLDIETIREILTMKGYNLDLQIIGSVSQE